MAGAFIGVEADDRVLREYLAQLQEKARDLSGPFDEIGQYLVSEFQDTMERGVSPSGENWGQSKPSERATRENGQTLIDRGHLRDSITHDPFEQQLDVGSAMIYAAIHQFGGQTGRGHTVNMPARPWLGWNPDYAAESAQILSEYLQ